MATNFGKLNFATSFNPSSAFPLDARSYFESYEAAVAAAASAEEVGSSNTTYYYGEVLTVMDSSAGTSKLYIIKPDKTLMEIGAGTAPIVQNSGEISGTFKAGEAVVSSDRLPAGCTVYQVSLTITAPAECNEFSMTFGTDSVGTENKIVFIGTDGESNPIELIDSSSAGSYSFDLQLEVGEESNIFCAVGEGGLEGTCVIRYKTSSL